MSHVRKSSAPQTWGEYNVCLFGDKGIGKTTLAAEYPKALHFLFERGRHGIEVDCVTCKTWETAAEELQRLIRLKKRPYQTLIWDCIDRAAAAAEESRARELGYKTLAGIEDYGKSWKEFLADWHALFYELDDMGYRHVFLSHCRVRPRVTRSRSRASLKNDPEPEMLQPTVTGWCQEFLSTFCDYTVYYGFDGTERVFWVRGDESLWARCVSDKFFVDKRSKELLSSFTAGTSAQEAYQRLTSAFKNQVSEE